MDVQLKGLFSPKSMQAAPTSLNSTSQLDGVPPEHHGQPLAPPDELLRELEETLPLDELADDELEDEELLLDEELDDEDDEEDEEELLDKEDELGEDELELLLDDDELDEAGVGSPVLTISMPAVRLCAAASVAHTYPLSQSPAVMTGLLILGAVALASNAISPGGM